MTISIKSFESSQSACLGSIIAQGRHVAGYSVEDLAVTCGLTVGEIEAIEEGRDADPGRLKRIAAALQLPLPAL
jgi:transcriptional regulator with XRE-family HTH domain